MTTSVLNRDKIIVGVLRGGPSNEYDVSLKTGAHVLRNLPERFYPQDIFISKDGHWHTEGKVKSPEFIIPRVDVIFNALHGRFGEDGKIQAILNHYNTPYTGSKTLSSALGMHKGLSKRFFLANSIQTPNFIIIDHSDNTHKAYHELFRSFLQPSVIKPLSGGSSVATAIARNFSDFKKGIEYAFKHDGKVLIEEYIDGKEATCGVLDASDGKSAYALFPVEIIPHGRKLFDYSAKYEGQSDEICPSTFSEEIKKEIQRLSLSMHMTLGLRHYSRSDFIIHPTRGIFALEVNSLPGLTETCPYPQSLHAAGITTSDFIDHIIELALKERGY